MSPDAFTRLIDVVRRLREPGGCPWDREQTHASLTPFMIEEAHEAVDAIQREATGDELKEELGDVLLQVVLHARIAEEDERFTASDVADALADKLVRRHPHVFGDAEKAKDADDVVQRWESIKAKDRKERGETKGVLDGVPKSLPALLKAQRLTEKAGRSGFDWPEAAAVLDKLREELAELEHDVRAGDTERAAGEFGDVLFVLANLARHLKIDAEDALQRSNAKFVRRFAHVEARLRERGQTPSESTLEEMDALWDEAKAREKR